ncbi:MAG: hypothetical protein JNK04_05190 [Myxococcales bacterium]|nr:hypothetical protein [Myxococcales bacterium]
MAFDLDAKAQTPGGHGWWWELVISEDPSPAPYQDLVSHFLYAKNALVLEFNGFDCTGGDGTQNQLSRVVIEEGYAITKDFIYDDIEEHGCFATAHEVLNHIEVRFSQDDLEVWATDLDDPDSFRIVAKVSGMGLAFSRGYVNLQHSHYNASKGGLDGFTTFHVGSFGFDGPSLALSRSYDVPDAMTPPGNAEADHVNLGYLIQPEGNVETCCDWSSQPALTFEAVDLTDAVGAHLNLNALDFVSGVSILQRWNGGEWRTFAHPYPDDYAGTRTVTIPVEVGDLVSGTNTLEMKTEGSAVSIANIELEVVPE